MRKMEPVIDFAENSNNNPSCSLLPGYSREGRSKKLIQQLTSQFDEKDKRSLLQSVDVFSSSNLFPQAMMTKNKINPVPPGFVEIDTTSSSSSSSSLVSSSEIFQQNQSNNSGNKFERRILNSENTLLNSSSKESLATVSVANELKKDILHQQKMFSNINNSSNNQKRRKNNKLSTPNLKRFLPSTSSSSSSSPHLLVPISSDPSLQFTQIDFNNQTCNDRIIFSSCFPAASLSSSRNNNNNRERENGRKRETRFTNPSFTALRRGRNSLLCVDEEDDEIEIEEDELQQEQNEGEKAVSQCVVGKEEVKEEENRQEFLSFTQTLCQQQSELRLQEWRKEQKSKRELRQNKQANDTLFFILCIELANNQQHEHGSDVEEEVQVDKKDAEEVKSIFSF